MALTLDTSPDLFSALYSYKGIRFVVSSNAGTIDKLRINVEVNISGWTDVITFDQRLDLNSSDTFTCPDIGQYISNYIYQTGGGTDFTDYLPTIGGGALGAPPAYVEYRVVFTEVLDGGSTGTTTTTSSFYGINSSLQYKADQDLDDYLITVDSTATEEFILNGDFDSGDGWTDGSPLTTTDQPLVISGGVATATLADGEDSGAYQNTNLIAGIQYRFRVTITESGAGDGYAYITTSLNGSIDKVLVNQILASSESFDIMFTPTVNSNEFSLFAYASGNTVVTFDDVSIIQNLGFLSPSGDNFKFFTNIPSTKWIREGESEYIMSCTTAPFFPDMYQIIKTYSKNGTLIQTAAKSIAALTLPPRMLPAGYSNINAITSLTTGTQPIVDENVYKYEVYLSSDSSGFLKYTETRTFKIDRKCYENTVRFHFLNRLGGIDSFTATGRYIRGLEVDSEQYQKLLVYNYSIGDRGLEEANIDAKNLFSINTGIITKATAIWLMELKTSPQVFIEVDDQYCPVIITNKNKIDVDYNKNIQDFDIEYIEASPILVQKN